MISRKRPPQLNSKDGREIIMAEIRNAMPTYFQKNVSVDKCALQKWALAAFNGLYPGKPWGTVGE